MSTIANLEIYRARFHCHHPRVDEIFETCLTEAQSILSEAGVEAWLDGASLAGNLGRGTELGLIFLEEIPAVVAVSDESLIPEISRLTVFLSRNGAPKAIAPFLNLLPACARRLGSAELLSEYLALIRRFCRQSPEALPTLLNQAEYLLGQLSLGGLKNWIDYGLRAYRDQAHRMGDYFGLQTADSLAALQRERHGTLFADHERRLDLYLKAFWEVEELFHPYSLAFDLTRRPLPFLDQHGLHVPDVYDDMNGVRGIDRYRALISHMIGHRLHTRPFIADNFNRYQQLFIEVFEDSRVECLLMRQFPGLRRVWMALHPIPKEGDCPADHSPIRHLAAQLSRALLDPDHPYTDPRLLDIVAQFHARIEHDPYDTTLATDLGVSYLVKVHDATFRYPKVFFTDTEIGYRDDNRYLWIFLEDTDEEDDFHSDHAAANPLNDEQHRQNLLARHHHEWDYQAQHFRPDWATVYESQAPSGQAAVIDELLAKNPLLAKRLKRIVDLLKPQQSVRIRYQENGSELDLDVAIRARVDYQSGTTPDPRIYFSHRPDGRDISVMLLLDLSESIKETPKGYDGSILQLSQEAVSLLAWAVDALGDPFAIAGFSSNTRHEVHYQHFKGFAEPWGEEVKSRLAGMQGGLSTRMGAAIRHAGHYLAKRNSEKKLLLVLTDGEPSDIDVEDPAYLLADTRKAVEEMAGVGIHTYCISLDPYADDYVAETFGANHYTIIDRIDRLPERLPQLFMALTK
ncbi:MAG: VWA domain-containing protein [Methylococcaceae bacterium]|nr:VWA domain-containing protein [Methylococcaceae bacterium]